MEAGGLAAGGLPEARRGRGFYATQGPEFHQITVEDGVVTVECSPLKEVCFYSDAFYAADRISRAGAGETLTRASYHIGKLDNWIRVEGVDQNGKRCWSNYIHV